METWFKSLTFVSAATNTLCSLHLHALLCWRTVAAGSPSLLPAGGPPTVSVQTENMACVNFPRRIFPSSSSSHFDSSSSIVTLSSVVGFSICSRNMSIGVQEWPPVEAQASENLPEIYSDLLGWVRDDSLLNGEGQLEQTPEPSAGQLPVNGVCRAKEVNGNGMSRQILQRLNANTH